MEELNVEMNTADGHIDDIIESQQAPRELLEEKKLIRKLVDMKREGFETKEKFSAKWDRYHELYTGKGHWPGKYDDHRVTGQLNLIQNLVERKAALLTDMKPIIEVAPMLSTGAPDKLKLQMEETAIALKKVIEGLWAEHNIGMRLAEMCVYAQIFGGCGVNTGIEQENGLGGPDPSIFVLDPRCIAFDPYVFRGDALYKAQYMVTTMVKSTDWLRWFFKTDDIEPSSRYKSGNDDGPGTLGDKIRKLFGFSGGSTNAVDRTFVDEFWLKDYTRGSGKNGLKFPNGRHIVLVDERKILVDEENPYIDGKWPIDYMEWHMNLDSMWGIGDVELYESPQTLFNKVMSLIVENGILMNNSIWKGDADALSPGDWNKLGNEPGQTVKLRPGRRLERETPPPLSNGLFQMLETMMMGLEKVSGVTPAMEGQAAGQVTSGAAIDSLQHASHTIIRFKARQLESLLQRVGQKLISRIFQYMTDDRIFHLTGDSQQMLSYHWEAQKYLKDPEVAFKDFRFLIQPGSSLAQTRYEKSLQVVQMYQMGVVKNRKRVLDALEIPEREAIERENVEIDAKEAEMMQDQAEMEGEGSSARGGKGGPGGRRSDQMARELVNSRDISAGQVNQ